MDINANAMEDSRMDKYDQKLIGIDGYWYDVTKFIPHHPGGNIITRFVGKDASAVFHAFHKDSVLKHRKPYMKLDSESVENDEVTQTFAELGNFFEKEGYFKTNYYWYALKFCITFTLLLTVVVCVAVYDSTMHLCIGSLALAAFWQQCGFFMHDFEHNHFTHNRRVDKWLGTFFGSVCFGVSGSWWRGKHFIHHAVTTCVDYETSFVDPQMVTPKIWAQNEKLWPFFQNKFSMLSIRIQHLTFLPLCVFVGRFAILRASAMEETQTFERVALALHWFWVSTLLSYLPSWSEVFAFYSIAAFVQGVLHVQLLISHYAKSYHEIEEVSTTISWSQMQVESNIDITTPWWLDWFHGGLNFHLVHHLYPRMPRHNYRRATELVKAACQKHGLVYDHCGWFEAVSRTLKQLRLMSSQFTLDPR